MTKIILTAERISSNCKKEESKSKTRASEYLTFLTVRKMIYKLLNCDRIILIPTKIPKFTELALASKLNITLKQLKELQRSQSTYKQTISKINLPLIELYCCTKWR